MDVENGGLIFKIKPILKKKESVPGTADNTPEEESKTITGIISPYKSKRLDSRSKM